VQKAMKVRIYPTSEQADFLNQQFGATRFTYNKALAIISHQYKRHGLSLKASRDIKPMLAAAKKSRKYGWLKAYDSIALQESCRNLNTAFSKFFKKQAGYPKFKKKHGRQSSYHCTTVCHGEHWIEIPKLNTRIKARIHRSFEGLLKSITLSRTVTGKYYASLLFDIPGLPPKPVSYLSSGDILGLDVGICHLVIDSKGHKIGNPRYLIKAQKHLRRKQKALSRKQKGSSGRARARQQLAKCHEKIAYAREDFQHKLSRQLIDENQAVVVETLKVKNMLKNSCLAKHIADCAWSSLLDKLRYKAKQSGKRVVKINQWFASSKTCSCCGHKVEQLPLSIRQWRCPTCHHTHDRDINAALNVKQQGVLMLKAEGLSVSANGGLRKTERVSAVA